jgi:predicted metal-dependent phosphoesterase TrpH
MNLDLHVHSVFSGDSPVKPFEYARRLVEMQSEYEIDGFVLMEHNFFITRAKCDLEELSREHGLVILSGVEVDTHWGHLLVYGMTERLWAEIQENGSRKQEPVALARAAAREGALCVPAHPFRWFIGMGERSRELEGICAVETINASDKESENAPAGWLAHKMGWAGTGGSDAHFPLELGKAMTCFEKPVLTMQDIILEIKARRCRAVTLDQARKK